MSSSTASSNRARRLVLAIAFLGMVGVGIWAYRAYADGFNDDHIATWESEVKQADKQGAITFAEQKDHCSDDHARTHDTDALYRCLAAIGQTAGGLEATANQLTADSEGLSTVVPPMRVWAMTDMWQLGIPAFKGRVQVRVSGAVKSMDCGERSSGPNGVPWPETPFCGFADSQRTASALPYLAAVGRVCPAEGCRDQSSKTSSEPMFLIGSCLDLDGPATNGIVQLVVNEAKAADYRGDNGDTFFAVEYEHNPATGCREEKYTY